MFNLCSSTWPKSQLRADWAKGKGLRYRDPSSRQVCQIPSVKKRAYRLINPAVSVPQVAS